jgi:toxic protein SymE
MGGNPYDPLTTTNSSEELTMADANLKASTAPAERHIKIQQAERERPFSYRPRKTPAPLYPWIKLAGRWLEQAGFEAGQSVRVQVEHGRLVITPA